MQLHLPDAIAIREQLLGPPGGQSQPTRLKQGRRRARLARQLRSSCREPQKPTDNKSDEFQRGQHFNQH